MKSKKEIISRFDLLVIVSLILLMSIVGAARTPLRIANTLVLFQQIDNNYDNDIELNEINLLTIKNEYQHLLKLFNLSMDQNYRVDFDVIPNGINTLVERLEISPQRQILIILDENNRLGGRPGRKEIGFCTMSDKLSIDLNKNILFWPCPKMRKTKSFLPSFEIISFAIKSIAEKDQWTEAIIFSTGSDWGLPLAIAANLHVPYRIQIGTEHLDDVMIENNGEVKVVIVTSKITSMDTVRIITHFRESDDIKIILIDVIGSMLNKQNKFFMNLKALNNGTDLLMLRKRLQILTTLTGRIKEYSYNSLVDFKDIELNDYDTLITNEQTVNYQHHGHEQSYENDGEQLLRPSQLIRDPNTSELFKQTDLINFIISLKIMESTSSLSSKNLTSSVFNRQSSIILKNCTDLNQIAINLLNTNENCIKLHKSIEFCENLMHLNYNFPLDQVNNVCKRINQILQVTGNQLESMMTNQLNFKNSVTKRNLNRTEFELPSLYGDRQYWNISNLYNRKHRMGEYFNIFDFIVNCIENGQNLRKVTNQTIIPISQQYDFIVLDFNLIKLNATTAVSINTTEWTINWLVHMTLKQSAINHLEFNTLPHPGHDSWIPPDPEVILRSCGLKCGIVIAIVCILLLLIVVGSVVAGIMIRNCLLKKRLSKGPNKIVLAPTDFEFPIDSRRVDEGIEAMLCCWLQQLQEFGGPEVEKPDLLKGSLGSLKNLGLPTATATSAVKTGSGSGTLARHNTAVPNMRARYNGDLVQLKEVPMTSSVELKSKAMDLLIMAHGLRHENINPLIGWLSDPNRTALVYEYCTRGSLQDVLIMDEIKLDWSFRLSLLTDLVRGMRYLHSSPIKVHGSLTSRNCVIDARWVLKITDYCMPSFYEAQSITPAVKTAKALLWTAPEALRSPKGPFKYTTQPGDVYSFGIIMQEVVVRGEPYCMLSLSPEEIITKIKKPPPLIRPSVSKGAAPPEAINIMRQCWAESPEMRPDFNNVYERFKQLNHGRKVNFVDTMFQMLEKYSNNLEDLIRERTEQLDQERKKTDKLLHRMLPSYVAERLKLGLNVEPEMFSDVTIYFSDIVGFTTISSHCTPVQVVDLLNELYTIFDATVNAYDVYKVETIGDAYMVVSGLPVRNDDHAEQIATMALDLLHHSGMFKVKHLPGVPIQLRIGLNTGPCCAGVVGLTMPRYCLFGDTVNVASRMESSGSSWRIHLSELTKERLEIAGGYTIEPRGPIEIKGKGWMNTYWLLGKKGFDKPLPTPPPIGESHGLDEAVIKDSMTLKALSNNIKTTPNLSANHSSSQSSSLAGELIDVKVEITPPVNTESNQVINSLSLDSNTVPSGPMTLNLNEFQPVKPGSTSPQQRKMSELSVEGLLNPANFGRFTPSPTSTASTTKLYKKIEEMMDLSSPYNHYRCLSPSENNLSQFNDGKYLYSNFHKIDKPGSGRLLRRQFSLDKDDASGQNQNSNKQSLDLPPLCYVQSTVKISNPPKLQRQNSASLAIDLEKIEEIPMSPSGPIINHSSESSLNRISDADSPSSIRGRVSNNKEISLNVEALLSR